MSDRDLHAIVKRCTEVFKKAGVPLGENKTMVLAGVLGVELELAHRDGVECGKALAAAKTAQQDAPTDAEIEAIWRENYADLIPVVPFAFARALLARYAPAQDAERERDRQMLNALVDQLASDEASNGDAPGHHHEVPGIWNSDNGELAGKPCAWCALWRKARAQRAAAQGDGDA